MWPHERPEAHFTSRRLLLDKLHLFFVHCNWSEVKIINFLPLIHLILCILEVIHNASVQKFCYVHLQLLHLLKLQWLGRKLLEFSNLNQIACVRTIMNWWVEAMMHRLKFCSSNYELGLWYNTKQELIKFTRQQKLYSLRLIIISWFA